MVTLGVSVAWKTIRTVRESAVPGVVGGESGVLHLPHMAPRVGAGAVVSVNP